MISIADTLSCLEPHLEVGLVSPDSSRAIAAVAARLPAALSDWGYLECRLAEEESQVDLILRIGSSGREILKGANPAVLPPDALLMGPIWHRIRSAAHAGGPADPRGARQVGSLWLEFDVESYPASAGEALAPGLFLGVGDASAGSRSARICGARTALESLLDGAIPPRIEDALEWCHAQLPAGAFVAYVGLFPHRDPSAVRLCVAGLDHVSAPGFLDAMGWQGHQEEIRAFLAEIHRSRRRDWAPGPSLVHFDIGDGIGDRIGLEYVCAHRPQLRQGVAETAFLNHLVALEVCTPAKLESLLAWPGYTMQRLPHELWRSLLVRRLNHVKLVIGPDAVPQAKAYLSYHHLPYPRR